MIRTFKELKKSGWFDYPNEYIDPGIRELCRRINELPYAATRGSCAGHTTKEWLARGFSPPPSEINHAYVSVYVSDEHRRTFFKWLKDQIDINKVNIHMTPVGTSREVDPFEITGGSKFERWEPTMDVVFTKDKAFDVYIVSKKLHIPLRHESLNPSAKEEYRRFYNKAAEHLKVADELLEVPELELIETNTNFIIGRYKPRENLIMLISGKRADPEKVKEILLHELLHATYPERDEQEILEVTESYWLAYKAGKFAV